MPSPNPPGPAPEKPLKNLANGHLSWFLGARTRKRRTNVVAVGYRSRFALALAAAISLAALSWPLLIPPGEQYAHTTDAPLVFAVMLPILVLIILAELADGGIDSKALAMLAVLSGIGAALRPLGAGLGGIEPIFFLMILAGRVFGPGFGFVLGNTTMFTSALITGGVGPWLPFQMMAAGWLGLGAGLLPRAHRLEVPLLAAYGVVAAFLYGLVMNLWFWPFAVGYESQLSYVPGDPVWSNLQRFLAYSVATSLGFDAGRAITNVVLILATGTAVLATLRRALRRAAFDHPRPPDVTVQQIDRS